MNFTCSQVVGDKLCRKTAVYSFLWGSDEAYVCEEHSSLVIKASHALGLSAILHRVPSSSDICPCGSNGQSILKECGLCNGTGTMKKYHSPQVVPLDVGRAVAEAALKWFDLEQTYEKLMKENEPPGKSPSVIESLGIKAVILIEARKT